MCCILIRHMTVYAKTPIFKRFLKMSNLLETWRQQSAHNTIVDTEADGNGDDADNEKLEAAMPFVIIRGNINGQIRHGISCSAFQSKKGNLSNLSSPPPSPSPNLRHYYCLQHTGHVTSHVLFSHHHHPGMNNTGDDKYACDDVEGWPERRACHGKVWIFILG